MIFYDLYLKVMLLLRGKFSNSSILVNEVGKNKKLIVVFGGIFGLPGMPVFEFKKILDDLDADKIFIRDLDQVWYFKGLKPFSFGVKTNKRFLEVLTRGYKQENIIFLGNSAGGFAALLYGSLLRVGKIVAFSPQTFLSERKRTLFNDKRWEKNVNKLQKSLAGRGSSYLDLSSLEIPKESTVYLHYPTRCSEDILHIKNMKVQSNLNLVGHDFDTHLLIKDLKSTGGLEKIIIDVLNGSQR